MTLRTRHLPTFLLACSALLLSACGGGGTSPATTGPDPTPVGKALLDGQVLEVDGTTTALAGLAIRLVEDGRIAVTGDDGTFGFGEVPTGSLTLQLVPSSPNGAFLLAAEAPGSGAASGSGGGGGQGGSADDGNGGSSSTHDDHENGHHEDEVEDGEHGEGQEMHVHRIENREQVRVRIRVEDGGICEMTVSREAHREREVEIQMTRTEANDDPDMEGRLELESRDDRERFKVRVESADEGRDLEVFVIAPDGSSESQGARTVDVDGQARWTLDTSSGGRLPFAVASVEDLEGYVVEVRGFDDGTVLLTATAPELPPFVGDGTPGEPGEGEQVRSRARARLTVREPGLEGHVEIRSRPDDGRERFTMEAEHLAVGRRVCFEIEMNVGSGVFERIRTRTADGAGEAELELDTGDGDVLPNGALRARELERHRVRVCDDATGETLMEGTVPELVPER